MLTYNTNLRPLLMPQYGRNIQNMVEHCLTIENREERTLCAQSIVAAMLTISPVQGDKEEHMRKLWDHLHIMSNFQLDVDRPYEIVDATVFADTPDPIALPHTGAMPYRQYGAFILEAIRAATTMPEGEERLALITLIANQMKKLMMANNKEGVDDERIFNDIRHISKGEIRVDASTVRLQDYTQPPTPSGRKKKKK